MKRVFSNSDQVIHLWANQSQSDAKSKNVFFSGKKIYSYGYHYELGRLVEVNGITVALINDSGYSVTTSKHIYRAWSAVSHMPRVKVSRDFDLKSGLLATQDKLINEVFGLFNQKKFYGDKYSLSNDNEYLIYQIEDFNLVCNKLGFSQLVLNIPTELVELIEEHAKFRIQRNIELNSVDNLKRKNELALKRAEKQVLVWRTGGPLVDAVRKIRPMILRVKDNEVQTSGGASVPLDHALRLLKRIESGSAKQGTQVGHFKLDSVSGDNVKIGCHTISLLEAKTVLANLKPKLSLVGV